MENSQALFMRGGAAREVFNELRTTFIQPAQQSSLKACSACAGDYEDPDRTAWDAEKGDRRADEDAQDLDSEEFPPEG